MLKFEKSINQVILELKNWVLRKFRLGLNNQKNQNEVQDQMHQLHHDDSAINQKLMNAANASIYSSAKNSTLYMSATFTQS